MESLLKAASVLLGRGNAVHAVWVLHSEVRRRLELVQSSASYGSRYDAEGAQRELMEELRRRRRSSGQEQMRVLAHRASWFARLQSSLPLWVSWATIAIVAGALTIRYAFAVVQRERWKREYSDGSWISRYRDTLAGTTLMRYDVGIDYDWGTEAPVPTMPRDNWTGRWDTCLIVTRELELELRLIADYSAKLTLDGVPQIELRKTGRKSANVRLRTGVRHLQLDYRDRSGRAVLRLDGLDFLGTDSYRFQRPVLEQGKVSCPVTAADVVGLRLPPPG